MDDDQPMNGEESALTDHFRHLDCPGVVDPVDVEDCAGMAVEVIRFLRARGWAPRTEVAEEIAAAIETQDDYEAAYRWSGRDRE